MKNNVKTNAAVGFVVLAGKEATDWYGYDIGSAGTNASCFFYSGCPTFEIIS